jgi:hypothetical protein
MLETVREFGLECLVAIGAETTIRERHAAYVLGLARSQASAWTKPDYASWLDRVELERGNLRAALGWALAGGRADLLLQLASAARFFWRARGPVSEGLEWLERALARSPETPTPLRARALQDAGDLAAVGGDPSRAVAWSTKAVEAAHALADSRMLVLALETMGRAWLLAGEADRSAACHEEGIVLAREHGYGWALAVNLSNLGIAVRMQGDFARAVALQE